MIGGVYVIAVQKDLLCSLVSTPEMDNVEEISSRPDSCHQNKIKNVFQYRLFILGMVIMNTSILQHHSVDMTWLFG